jgi:ATP-dependent DNA ligase
VVVDDRGVSDFERLRSALVGRDGSRLAFLYGFDLLELDGDDLRRYSWEIRARPLPGYCARRARASAFPNTLMAMAGLFSNTPARWASRAS